MGRSRTALIVALTLILIGSSAPAHAQSSAAVAFIAPEGVFFDPGTKSWFISNLGPMFLPDSKDGDGYISRLDSASGILTERWIDGLDGPKGMRVFRGKLYVADVDTLNVIDIASAKIVQRIRLPGATILNDVDLDKAGNAYVTDWTGNRIYRVDRRGRPSVLIANDKLEGPNGILVEGRFLTVAAWGTNIASTFPYMTDEPGRILRVDIAHRTIKPLGSGERIAGLDGIERDGKSYIATDWSGGRVLRIALDGSYTTLMQLPPSVADLGFDRSTRTIGVPVILASAVVFDNV